MKIVFPPQVAKYTVQPSSALTGCDRNVMATGLKLSKGVTYARIELAGILVFSNEMM